MLPKGSGESTPSNSRNTFRRGCEQKCSRFRLRVFCLVYQSWDTFRNFRTVKINGAQGETSRLATRVPRLVHHTDCIFI